MRRINQISIVLILVMSSLFGFLTISPNVESEYTSHDPILIEGDDDFAAQAASEGWPGDGTEGNPYVIEGYEITRERGYSTCINIRSTDVHFVIKDSKIKGSSYSQNIFLNNVKNGKIYNCIIEKGSLGIYIWFGSRVIITNNTLINNDLLLWETSDCTCIANKFLGGGYQIKGFELKNWNTHNIDTSNTVNGKPVRYWKNRNGGTVPSGAGQVILVNCTYAIVENQEFTNVSSGIILGYSSKNYINGNTIHSNKEAGIELWISSENSISGNKIYSNKQGINLQNSNNNTIRFNEIQLNMGKGISIQHPSDGNYIIDNHVFSNDDDGIYIGTLFEYPIEYNLYIGNTIKNNNISNNMRGIYIENSNGNCVISNFVDSNSYGLYLNNCDENILKNNIASHNSAGFYFFTSNKNKMIGNTVFDNYYGIRLREFSNGTRIIGNNISSNYYGINFRNSCDNIFHHNNIFNNTIQLRQDDSTNSWDDDKGEGNYWSDYSGLDDGSDGRIEGDGIGDTDLPHQRVDYYPLMEPVDITEYGEDKEEESKIFSEVWFKGLIFLIIIVIIVILALRLQKKRKYPKSPSKTKSHQNSQNQPKF